MKQIVKNFIGFIAVTAVISGFNGAAFGAAETVTLEKAKLSLLDGGASADGKILAGLAINLVDGVKTYWRMPGDSGLPPVFDFSASRNVDHVEIAWPVPTRLKDADGTILGYQDNVVFPLIVIPKDMKKPVVLTMTIDFGLCDTLCLPASATLTRELASGGAARSTIESFLARVPKRIDVKADQSPTVLSIDSKTGTSAMVMLSIRSASALRDVILEGPGSWYFGLATIASGEGGIYRVTVPIEQKPSAATLGGLSLTITAIADMTATETTLTLDAAGSIR